MFYHSHVFQKICKYRGKSGCSFKRSEVFHNTLMLFMAGGKYDTSRLHAHSSAVRQHAMFIVFSDNILRPE